MKILRCHHGPVPNTAESELHPFLRIVRRPFEEPDHVNLIVAANNGRQRGELEIYANAEDLEVAAQRLAGFPANASDTFLWELGSEKAEDRFAFYFRLRFWQVAPGGECGVELRLNNNEEPPRREVSEFSFTTYPADINRLAELLREFSKLRHLTLEWTITDGSLDDASR